MENEESDWSQVSGPKGKRIKWAVYGLIVALLLLTVFVVIFGVLSAKPRSPAGSPNAPGSSPSDAPTRPSIKIEWTANNAPCATQACSNQVQAGVTVDGSPLAQFFGGPEPMGAVNGGTPRPFSQLLPSLSTYGSQYASGIPTPKGYLAIVLTMWSAATANSPAHVSSGTILVPSTADGDFNNAAAVVALRDIGDWVNSFSPQGNTIPVAATFVSFGDASDYWNSSVWQRFLSIPDLKISAGSTAAKPGSPIALVLPLANPFVSGLLGSAQSDSSAVVFQQNIPIPTQ